ncbi:MAG: zinc ribbon-containing protein [Gemmataceae bacterium]|nr:zinc ribbon-containing protein [Gemmataceae bacterium]
MRIRFACPECDKTNVGEGTSATEFRCVHCGHEIQLQGKSASLDCCSACGNIELYRKKDFPQWLGMGLLALACLLFYLFAIQYRYAIAWSILLGSAAIDGIIYYIVGDVVVCYRCGCEHRGIPSRTFDPHSLATAEKYRQERLRREKLRAESAKG